MYIGRATAVVAAALVLAGCGQAPAQPSPTGASTAGPAEASAPGASPCDLLDEATVADLAGGSLDASITTIPGTAISACTFDGFADQAFHIQVAQAPAGQWANSLPALADSLHAQPEGAVDPGLLEQLDQASALIEEGKLIPADEACEYFGRLVEVQGLPAGSTKIVTFLPNRESPLAVAGQQCVDGTYTTLLVGRPDISESSGLAEKIDRILEQLE